MSHSGFRFDDYHVWGEFWHSLNHGWEHMDYVYKFEEFWGKGSYPPEQILLSPEDYDALVEKLNEASAPPLAPRKKTRPSRGAIERRLDSKKRDSAKKQDRRLKE